MKKFILFIVLVLGTACLIMLSEYKLPAGWPIPVLVTAIMMDFLTTYLCLRVGGREGNRVVAFVFKRAGIWGTFMASCVLWAIIIHFRVAPSNLGSQTAVALAYWLVPVNNVIVLVRLHKKKRMAEC